MAAFTAQIPNVMSQLGNSIMNSAATGGPAGLNAQSRATFSLGNQQRIIQKQERPKQLHFAQKPVRWVDKRSVPVPEFENPGGFQSHIQWNRETRPNTSQVELLQPFLNDSRPSVQAGPFTHWSC